LSDAVKHLIIFENEVREVRRQAAGTVGEVEIQKERVLSNTTLTLLSPTSAAFAARE
jgi:hypothetical protein